MKEYYFQSATLLKVTLLHGCFSRFLNCTCKKSNAGVSETNFTFYNKHFFLKFSLNKTQYLFFNFFMTKRRTCKINVH